MIYETHVAMLVLRGVPEDDARVLCEHEWHYVDAWLAGDFGPPSAIESVVAMLSYALIKRGGAFGMARNTIRRRTQLCEDWATRAETLWQLLDDIDTLDDACRGDDEAFRAAVRRIHVRRHAILESDGYKLHVPTTLQPEKT